MSYQPPVLETLANEWHYGVTGAGKSHAVRTKYPAAFIKSNNMWWDGYQGEPVVIIEDLGPKIIAPDKMKLWADKYPFKAEVKGAHMYIRPEKIVVTSNYRIGEIWEDPADYVAIIRRFEVTCWPNRYVGK